MAGKGPTVTLTFAGDDKRLKATIRDVRSSTSALQKSLTVIGAGMGAFSAVGVAAPLAAAGAFAALAGGVLVAGTVAAAQSEKVKQAWSGLGDYVKKEVQTLAKPFEPVLLNIEDRVRAMFDRVKPMLGSMFETSAPYLSTLASGLIGFVEGALPGLKQGLENAKPIIQAISDGLRNTGPALGEFFRNLTGGDGGGAQQIADSVKQLFDWINWLLPLAGSFLNFMMEWGPSLAPVAGFILAIAGAIKVWTLAQAAFNLVMLLNPVGLWIAGIALLIAAVIWAYNNIDWFREGVQTAWNWIKEAFRAGVDKAKEIIQWFRELPGKAREWFGGFKDAARAKFDELVGFIRSIPGRIRDGLSNLGSLLIGAGRSLIEGLWSGIQGAIGWVKGKISGALSAIRDLFPFSPAKEGPFSGKGYTIHSGRAMMEDFGRGMTGVDLRSAAAGALGRAQGGLNAPTPGGTRGGGVIEMRVSGNVDSALVSLLHSLQRRGELQFVRA